MNVRSLRVAAGGVAAAIVVAGVLASCQSAQTVQAGELVVAIDSDMSLPKDVDAVRLEVYQGGPGGTLVFGNTYSVPQDQHLPATLAVVAGGGNNVVDIRVLGVLGDSVKVLREAVTTVPTDRQVTLRMPVAWLCYGQVNESSPGNWESSCPSGQTCVEGACQTATVVSNTLSLYKPADIFGGAAAPGNMGTCFDTVGCFAMGYVPTVDTTNCTVPAPTGGVGMNFGMVTSAGTGIGICGTDSCYIPLDQSVDEGWSQNGDVVQLPTAVCDRLKTGQILSVVATTSCETKTPAIPTCGAWSSVSSMPGTVDAAAPDGAVPVEDAAPDVVEEPEAEAAVEASSQMLSCPNVWTNIDTSACSPLQPYAACPAQTACALVSPNAVGCAPSNVAAIADQDAAPTTGKQGWPCAAAPGCADGTFCNSLGKCGAFCCTNADCTATGVLGVTCTMFTYQADGGVSEGGSPTTPGTFGICQ